MPHVHLGGSGSYRGFRGAHTGFGATLLRLSRGDLRAAQSSPGAVGLCARTLLCQGDFDLGAPQVRGGYGYRRFSLFDTRLKVTCIKLREYLVRFHGLVVGNVHGKGGAIDLRTDRHNMPDHVGVVRRFMRLIVLPEVPAIWGTYPEQQHQQTVQGIPEEWCTPLCLRHARHSDRDISSLLR